MDQLQRQQLGQHQYAAPAACPGLGYNAGLLLADSMAQASRYCASGCPNNWVGDKVRHLLVASRACPRISLCRCATGRARMSSAPSMVRPPVRCLVQLQQVFSASCFSFLHQVATAASS